MEPEKDKWINTILGSLDGIQRAEPSPFLFAKIQNKLNARPEKTYVSRQTVWLAAASFVVLAVLNWQLVTGVSGTTKPNTGELNTVITDMHLYPTSQPYDAWSGPNY